MLPNGKAELAAPETAVDKTKVLCEKVEWFLICGILLMMAGLSYSLYCNMQDNWQLDPELRCHIFFIAFLMLLLSIVICYYIRYRLSSQVVGYHINQQSYLISVNSQLQLITTELPPSYESIMKYEAPPPYNFEGDRLHMVSAG